MAQTPPREPGTGGNSRECAGVCENGGLWEPSALLLPKLGNIGQLRPLPTKDGHRKAGRDGPRSTATASRSELFGRFSRSGGGCRKSRALARSKRDTRNSRRRHSAALWQDDQRRRSQEAQAPLTSAQALRRTDSLVAALVRR